MLRSINSLEEYLVSGTDGDVGRVRDVYFDDEHWTMRYLVVDTGGFWKGPHEVLVSPMAFERVDWATRRVYLSMTGERVRNSPAIALDKPVSRQYEEHFSRYYDWPAYWSSGGVWGTAGFPGVLASRSWIEPLHRAFVSGGDSHLRSAQEVVGYRVKGRDAELGFVGDFFANDESWTFHYMAVDTHKWWPGKTVVLSPRWIDQISWSQRRIEVDIPRELVQDSPPWSALEPFDRAYEARLFEHYGRTRYWSEQTRALQEREDTVAHP